MKLVGRMNPCLFFALVISFFCAPICRDLHVYLSWKTYFCKESFLAIKCYWVLSGAIIADGDRKPWDPRGPMIWDNFSIFRTNCAILTSYLSANPRTCRGFSRVCCHVTWSKIVRVESFNFTAKAGNEGRGKKTGLFYALLRSELIKNFPIMAPGFVWFSFFSVLHRLKVFLYILFSSRI